MPTKGPSNRYGTPRGQYTTNNPSGVNFQWAKDFNKRSLKTHFKKHSKEFKIDSIVSYRQHALRFCNYVDFKNNDVRVDCKGTTYKFNKRTKELALITKEGIIVSYYKANKGFSYNDKEKGKTWVKM